MSLLNQSDAAGCNLFSSGNGSFQQDRNTHKLTLRDENMIEIDPNYEQHIIEYHFMDPNRLSGLVTGRSKTNGPARPICPSYKSKLDKEDE